MVSGDDFKPGNDTKVPTKTENVSRPEYNFGPELTEAWKERFSKGLDEFQDVFIQSKTDVGLENVLYHDVELLPGPVIKERPRPIPPADLAEARQHVKDLLDAKIIAPSISPFASPIVLVRKRNGALRMVVDYRKVNSRTIRDSYALPKIEDLFLTLSAAKYFTAMDLSNAYYQVPNTERAKKISAFTTPFGLFQFERMAMGMSNSAATFQRLMDLVFQDLNLVELIVFLDDILVHAKTLPELEQRTFNVLSRLRKYGLKLDPKKCTFGATEVKHLGYIVGADGIRPDPEKVSAVKEWPVPKTVKEVKSFLGFTGFYRRFIQDYAAIARPLHDLTIGYYAKGCERKKVRPGIPILSLSSDISEKWKSEQQEAFDKLKECLISDPILTLADKTQPFELHVDASGVGLGAILYQNQKVIAYASRGLNKTEANYPAHKREFLALKWAMAEKFSDYLLGSKVTVVTDNNPLCYLLKNAKLDATSHRWLTTLSVFDFDIVYKPGKSHTDADELSRLYKGPVIEDEEYRKEIEKVEFMIEKAKKWDNDHVKAVLQSKCMFVFDENMFGNVPFMPAVTLVSCKPHLLNENVLEDEFSDLSCQTDWRKEQLKDRTLRKIIPLIEHK